MSEPLKNRKRNLKSLGGNTMNANTSNKLSQRSVIAQPLQ